MVKDERDGLKRDKNKMTETMVETLLLEKAFLRDAKSARKNALSIVLFFRIVNYECLCDLKIEVRRRYFSEWFISFHIFQHQSNLYIHDVQRDKCNAIFVKYLC